MNKRLSENKGITVVALIITIIVILIITAITINLSNNNDIVERSGKASTEYKISEEKEKITLAYNEYTLKKITDNNAELKIENNEANISINGENGWKIIFLSTDHLYTLSKDGKNIVGPINSNEDEDIKWTKNNNEITNGNVTLQMGDYVAYDELSSGEKNYSIDYTINGGESKADTQVLTTENLNWRVIGVNERGQLELISEKPTTSTVFLKGEKGYLNAENILNELSNQLYGKGKKAESARNINVNDINEIADITTDEKKKALDSNYGNVWRYRFPTTDEVSGTRYMQSSKDNGKSWSNITTAGYQKFRVPGDDNEISASNPGTREVTYSCYYYILSDKIKDNEIVNMLLKGTESKNIKQWLASTCTFADTSYAFFYARIINDNGRIYHNMLYRSSGTTNNAKLAFRPIVTLSATTKIENQVNGIWQIE